MSLEIIPALDVANGRLVRMRGRDPVAVEAFDGDPVRAARTFLEVGAGWVHLVDVGRAIGDAPPDLGTLRAVAATGARIQASGGIDSRTDAGEVLAAGAGRAVLGSHALRDRDELEDTLEALGPAAVLGVEVRSGAIRPRGGDDRGGLPLAETLTWLSQTRVSRILCTAVARVGGLEGPDLDVIALVARQIGRPVIAAGGIRGPEDLRRLAASAPGVEAAVIGRALYEGLELREALEVAATL